MTRNVLISPLAILVLAALFAFGCSGAGDTQDEPEPTDPRPSPFDTGEPAEEESAESEKEPAAPVETPTEDVEDPTPSDNGGATEAPESAHDDRPANVQSGVGDIPTGEGNGDAGASGSDQPSESADGTPSESPAWAQQPAQEVGVWIVAAGSGDNLAAAESEARANLRRLVASIAARYLATISREDEDEFDPANAEAYGNEIAGEVVEHATQEQAEAVGATSYVLVRVDFGEVTRRILQRFDGWFSIWRETDPPSDVEVAQGLIRSHQEEIDAD